MKMTRKFLSVLLAVVMVITSCSVCFSVFAIEAADLTDLIAALEGVTLPNSSTWDTSDTVNKGTVENYTTTYPKAGKEADLAYADLLALYNVFEALDDSIEKTGAWTATFDWKGRDGKHGTWLEYGPLNEIRDAVNNSDLTTLINRLGYGGMSHEDATAKDGTNNNKSDNENYPTNVTPEVTNTFIAKVAPASYLTQFSGGDYTKVPATPIQLGFEYKLTMTRVEDHWSVSSTCGSDNYWARHNVFDTHNLNPTYDNISATLYGFAAEFDTLPNRSYEELIAMAEDGTIDAFEAQLFGAGSAYQNALSYVGSEANFKKLYPSYADQLAALQNNIKSAKDFAGSKAVLDQAIDLINAKPDYGTFNYGAFDDVYDQMVADYANFKVAYENLANLGDAFLEYIAEQGYLKENGIEDVDYINNYFANFTDNVLVYDLQKIADTVENLYNEYADIHEDLELAEQIVVFSRVEGSFGELSNNKYSKQVKEAVFPNGYQHLIDFYDDLRVEINEYVLYFAENAGKSLVTESTADLIAMIPEVAANLIGLHAFYDEFLASADAERAARCLDDLVAEADGMADRIYETLAARFAAQINAVNTIFVNSGCSKDRLNAVTLIAMKTALDNTDEVIYETLTGYTVDDNGNDVGKGEKKDTAHYIDDGDRAGTTELYKFLKSLIAPQYAEHVDTFGFSSFETVNLSYKDREVYNSDKVKTESYKVTEELLNDTIAKLDTFLTSETFADLLSQFGLVEATEGGSGNMIADLLGDLLNGVIYSDSLVNALIGIFYPLVYDNFVEVFRTLPPTVDADIPVLGHQVLSPKYLKDLYQALDEMNVYIFPDKVGESLPAKYAKAAEVLKEAKYTQQWVDPNASNDDKVAIKYWDMVDLNSLEWGINEIEDLEARKAAFYDAFAAAFAGIKDLFGAFLVGNGWDNSTDRFASIKLSGIGAIAGDQYITLKLAAGRNYPDTDKYGELRGQPSANDGVLNALGPIYELLGYSMPDLDTLRSYTNDLVKIGQSVFEPLFSIVEDIAAHPVASILELLPNLSYALSNGMITPILSQLKMYIGYEATANINIANIDISEYKALEDGVGIDIGEMLNVEAALGFSLSEGLNGLLKGLGIGLPAIDEATLYSLGTFEKHTTSRTEWIYDKETAPVALGANEAVYIKANKADVAYFVLSYVANLLKDRSAVEDVVDSILNMVTKVDDLPEDATEEEIEAAKQEKIAEAKENLNGILDTVYGIVDIKDAGDVIAALVELLNTMKYANVDFSYDKFDDMSGEGIDEDTFYSIFWSKDEATYVSENLIDFVEKLAALLGFDITELLSDLLSSLYTRDNAVAVVDLVKGLLDGLDESIMNIVETVDPLVNLDVQDILTSLTAYEVPAFEDGDRDAFVAALVGYITPVVPVLKLLLVDSEEGSVLALGDDLVTVNGYNGYNSALVPILEALGCEGITPYATFATLDDEAMVMAVLDPILALLDRVSEDPINEILSILPNILYFLDSDGLNQALENLLRPVYVLLDVVRPIVGDAIDLSLSLDISSVVNNLLSSIGLEAVDYSDLADTFKNLGTVSTYTSVTGNAVAKRLDVETALTPEFVTIILRMVVRTIVVKDNSEAIIESLRERGDLSEQNIQNIREVLESLRSLTTDEVLFVLYYVFFGANTGMEGFGKLAALVSENMQKALNAIAGMDYEYSDEISSVAREFLKAIKGLIDNGAESGNSTLGFFARVIAFFQSIIEMLLRIFTVFDVPLKF